MEIRTYDPRSMEPLLYNLSYPVMPKSFALRQISFLQDLQFFTHGSPIFYTNKLSLFIYVEYILHNLFQFI